MSITFEPVPEWLQDELDQMVEYELLRLDIPRKLDGFRYLTRAIARTIQEPDYIDRITKRLYPEVARSFNTNKTNVERCMRNAIKKCWDSKAGGREMLDQMAESHLIKHPTNSEFIALVAGYIRRTS